MISRWVFQDAMKEGLYSMYEITRSFHDEKQSESKLNFNNRESVEHQTLAEGNLITAKALYDDMQMKKYKKHKKRIGQNALKSAIESTEHSFKAVSCADENKDVILSGKEEEREKYDHTHNL